MSTLCPPLQSSVTVLRCSLLLLGLSVAFAGCGGDPKTAESTAPAKTKSASVATYSATELKQLYAREDRGEKLTRAERKRLAATEDELIGDASTKPSSEFLLDVQYCADDAERSTGAEGLQHPPVLNDPAYGDLHLGDDLQDQYSADTGADLFVLADVPAAKQAVSDLKTYRSTVSSDPIERDGGGPVVFEQSGRFVIAYRAPESKPPVLRCLQSARQRHPDLADIPAS